MKSIANYLVTEKIVAVIIVINSITIFLQGFPEIDQLSNHILTHIDTLCVVFFLLECIIKIKRDGGNYFKDSWNKFDFFVTLVSLPTIVLLVLPSTLSAHLPAWLGSLSVLRAGRLLRFLRLLKFIPNSQHLAIGIIRATKASVGIFIALALINITLAILGTMFFSQISPEHFGNPLKSSYTLLKLFTIEGWYEIPEEIGEASPESYLIPALKIYAIATVLVGGILGMGLANAIFIDEMTSDNTERIEKTLRHIETRLAAISNQLDQSKAAAFNKDET